MQRAQWLTVMLLHSYRLSRKSQNISQKAVFHLISRQSTGTVSKRHRPNNSNSMQKILTRKYIWIKLFVSRFYNLFSQSPRNYIHFNLEHQCMGGRITLLRTSENKASKTKTVPQFHTNYPTQHNWSKISTRMVLTIKMFMKFDAAFYSGDQLTDCRISRVITFSQVKIITGHLQYLYM